MCEEEGSGCVELVAGGREVEVTALNVYDYVRKYAHQRMMLSQEKALEVTCFCSIQQNVVSCID